ncbi:MAG TPA: hypothetical protein VGA52_10010 [Anaerolineales bacterium]
MTGHRWTWLLAVGLLAAAAAVAGLRHSLPAYAEYGAEAPVPLVPSMTGQAEYCLTCHQGIEAISASHPTEAFGCVRCHGGQPLALEKEAAHSGLLGGGNPSDFTVVEAACGGAECHSGPADLNRDHIQRSTTSLQATYASAIAAVRRAFGAQTQPEAHLGISAVTDPHITSSTGLADLTAFSALAAGEPAPVQLFGERCLSCHLQAEPLQQPGYQWLTGCAACHAVTNWQGTYTGEDPTIDRTEAGHAAFHQLTTVIPYAQCDTCHNRGNYSLVDMTFHARTDLPQDGSAGREDAYYQPIAQYTACEVKLDCIDCHPAAEAMGDGDLHSQMDQVQTVECRTCHGTPSQLPLTRRLSADTDPALRQASLNSHANLALGDTVVVSPAGDALWNVQQTGPTVFALTAKVSGQNYIVPLVAGSGCEQDPQEQSSSACHACHAVEHD